MKDEDLFHQALDQPPRERDAFLQAACDDDAGLRARVENLLRAHADPGSFLQVPAGAAYSPTVLDRPITESAGTTIGPYKLLEQIGEGGFGVVFMAEQTQPVRRRVALKVIKPGMDTRQVIARFEAERQALALMDHPNIAKVLEAGATETGRPYFVMELVRGVPVTEYCDEQQLTPHERLELFVTVCQAVQHAHQKGIIHRDIKPTNVLVTLHDDKPVVKVIDFGVAKAVVGQLTEKTLFTGFAQMIGTPLYMSPEQAAISGLDVDTRSDIYSLGVLLYELLTGTTPFDKERFRTAGYDEIRRIIREEEPVRPSTRISTLGRAAAISATRKTDPHALRWQCHGELDWIVMKCLEEGPQPPLRDACLAGGGRESVPRRRTGAGMSAVDSVSVPQVRPAEHGRAHNRIHRRTGSVAVRSGISDEHTHDRKRLDSRDPRQRRLAAEPRTRAAGVLLPPIALAQRELSVDNLGRALQLLEECPEDLRGWEWNYLRRLCQVEPLVLRGTAEFTSVAFSPGGQRLASASRDGAVKIWNSRTGQVLQELSAHSDPVVSVAFHPDGRHLASAGLDRQAKVWDLTTAQEVF